MCVTVGFIPCQMLLFCGMHAVGYKGAIPDMIINMIFKWGEENSRATPISIKSEPRKPLLALVLDMFMFQLQHVMEPPTDDIFVWAPVCVCVRAVFFLRGRFHIHIFLLADLTLEQLNWG